MARQSKHIRFQVAHKAAQIMTEEGIEDYGFAKRKAAKFFGLEEGVTLPSNTEINQAIKEHQTIFFGSLSQENIKLLRLEALNIMEKFHLFNPYLVSFIEENVFYPALKTQIHLYTDNTKELEFFLLNKFVDYKHSYNHKNGSYSILMEGKYSQIIVNIYSKNQLHSKLKKLSIKNLKKLLD